MPSKRDRSSPLPGFPRETSFRTASEIDAYLAGDKIQCLLCGRWMLSVGHHLPRAHGVSVQDYQDRYRIPRSRGVVGAGTRAAFSASVLKTIESGTLDHQQRRLAADAKEANRMSVAAVAGIMARGSMPVPDRYMIDPEMIRRALSLVAAGETLATARKRVGVSSSGFHEAMRRHPDLAEERRAALKAGAALRRKMRRDVESGRFI